MSINNSARGAFAPELIATMTGSPVVIGSLAYNPVVMYFDNLSTVSVVIFANGVQWKTFGAGTALSIDCRANAGNAENYTFPLGTTFTGTGASGDFSIAYTYALGV